MSLTSYSHAFKEEAICKTLQCGSRTIADMHDQLRNSM